MTMKTAPLFAFLLITLFSISPDSQAKVYKWVDENGRTHYSSRPPKTVEAEEMDIEEKPAPRRYTPRRPTPTPAPQPITTSEPTPTPPRASSQTEQPATDTPASNLTEAQKSEASDKCLQARRAVNKGGMQWLTIAKQHLDAGNELPEEYQEKVLKFKEKRFQMREKFFHCVDKYHQDEVYRQVINCLAALENPVEFQSCAES